VPDAENVQPWLEPYLLGKLGDRKQAVLEETVQGPEVTEKTRNWQLLAPAVPDNPAGQVAQVEDEVAPVKEEKVPAAQFAQLVAPELAENVPTEQLAQL